MIRNIIITFASWLYIVAFDVNENNDRSFGQRCLDQLIEDFYRGLNGGF